MIYFFVSQRNAGTIEEFLAHWGKGLAGRIRMLILDEIFARPQTQLTAGTYIFTSFGASLGSFDPPSPARQFVTRLHRQLVEFLGPARVLNDPSTFLRRLELLEALRERGINDFAAYRAGGPAAPARYPVFLRHAEGTQWDPPVLLRNRGEHEAAIAHAGDLAGLLAIEHRDTADATGVYRKYSCFVVGGRIVPRHLFFSRHWWVKEAVLSEDRMVEEELEFLETNPHEHALQEVCRIARCDYGRIDYALLDGRVQVWEINDTPLIAGAISSAIAARSAAHLRFVKMFTAALDAVDPPLT